MLKKIAYIIFASLILLGSTGITISKHYCGTSLKSISANVTPDNCCESPRGCCHNESFTFKIEDEFSSTASIFDFNTLAIAIPASIEIIQQKVIVKESLSKLSWEGPPPKIQEVLASFQSYLL